MTCTNILSKSLGFALSWLHRESPEVLKETVLSL